MGDGNVGAADCEDHLVVARPMLGGRACRASTAAGARSGLGEGLGIAKESRKDAMSTTKTKASPRPKAKAKPVLVERGRSWKADGTEVRRYTCGWKRIAARVTGDRVKIKRKLGVMCPGIVVALAELESLVTFLRWWERHQTRWAAFYWTCSGHPPGFGGESAFYQPPGRGRQVRVAMRSMGTLEGEDFTGQDVRVQVDPHERVAGVADLEARVFRRGERHGDPAGEEVGGVYRCGDLRLKADRNSVTVKRGKQWVEIEPDEYLFLDRLLAVERAR
jgi:hypothetical protein